MDKKEDGQTFAGLMATLSEVYDDGKPITKTRMSIYFEALAEYDIEVLKLAVSRMIKKRVYPSFPKPGEILEEIDGGKEDKSLLAWMMLVEGIRKIGSYSSVRFQDKTIHAVVNFLGGWEKVCEWREDELKWKQKEFERLYDLMKGRDLDDIGHLAGMIERVNSMNGDYHESQEVHEISSSGTQKLIVATRGEIDGPV